MANVQGYGLSKEELEKLQTNLTTFASGRIAAHMQEAANTALSRMKDRFNTPDLHSSTRPPHCLECVARVLTLNFFAMNIAKLIQCRGGHFPGLMT
jgi:hypothetical protein